MSQDLQSFLSLLEREGELARVRTEVDAELEITEIATRTVAECGPVRATTPVPRSRRLHRLL